MADMRRVVEGYMSKGMYNKLDMDPHVDRAWSYVRNLIGEEMFGVEFIPVPHISSSVYYSQLFVFIKERSMMGKIGASVPTYKVIGNLEHMLNRDASSWIPEFDFSPWSPADAWRMNMYQEYSYRVFSEMGSTPEKLVDVVISKPRDRSARLPLPGELIINRDFLQDLHSVKKIYIITDVVLADFVKVTVRLGSKVASLTQQQIPLGFRYRKYKLGREGNFLRELNTTLKYTEKDARWIVPTFKPILNFERWISPIRVYRSENQRRNMRGYVNILNTEEGSKQQIKITQQLISNNNETLFLLETANGIASNNSEAMNARQPLAQGHDLNEFRNPNVFRPR